MMEEVGNAVLPGILLHSHESGDYDSSAELVEDVEEDWDEYREEWGLDDYGTLGEEFDVETRRGLVRDEQVLIESSDYKAVFSEDLRSLGDKLTGEEANDGWGAEIYSTNHFGATEGPYKGRFLDQYVEKNFDLESSELRGHGAGN